MIPIWLDRGALSMLTPQDVVRQWFEARRGTSRKVFILGTVVPKGFLAESAYFSSRIRHSAPFLSVFPNAIIFKIASQF